MPIQLFPREQIVGVFRGFQEGGLEFHANLALPYRSDFQRIPMHGQFLLVQLESQDEAVLGRITSFSSEGRLSSGQGEEFNIRAVRESRPVPEDLREQYLKYRVNIRVLGVLRTNSNGSLTFVASHRRLPHVGSPVALPSNEVLEEIAGHKIEGAPIGHFALGEYVYAGATNVAQFPDWVQLKEPEILVKFPIESLVSRRSFIFARAGFGKSNLNKLLFSQLYKDTPYVMKRGDKQVKVGTIIFDPDGEYFWPDDKGRPGLCDVPALVDNLVVFTSRRSSSGYYQSFVAGDVKLDLRRLKPADVIAIGLSPERQEQQNVRKLKGLSPDRWAKLIDLIDANGNQTDIGEIGDILQLEGSQEAEALAARGNMTAIVRMLHSKSSQLMDMLLYALAQGKLCIVDVSQMRGGQALVLSGLILRRIFERNQAEFTEAEPKTIPTIAVVEEAQSVLNEAATSAEPYIAWVKEGRKYDLGAVLVTQQPGSIPTDILSQGDNWFIFHLLSAADLISVKKANAHFSDDLLSVLLNEPIPGHGVFWSSVGGKPYPVSIRALLFEKIYKVVDPDYSRKPVDTFAIQLHGKFESEFAATGGDSQTVKDTSGTAKQEPDEAKIEDEEQDVMQVLRKRAIQHLSHHTIIDQIRRTGAPWGGVIKVLRDALPADMDNVGEFAYRLVPQALDELLGPQHQAWHTFKHPGGKTYVKAGPEPEKKQ